MRLAARMVMLAGAATDDEDAEALVREAIASGAGVETFRGSSSGRAANPRVVDDYSLLPARRHIAHVIRAARRAI